MNCVYTLYYFRLLCIEWIVPIKEISYFVYKTSTFYGG